MDALTSFGAEYALLAVFGLALIERLGAPLPAFPALIVAGALAAQDPMLGVWALLLGLSASVLGDTAWYAAGWRFGRRVLGLICRVSLSPDACVRQTEFNFDRYGVAALVIAKFVPGLSTLAPSLAGALRLAPRHFFVFNTAGAALWAGAGVVVGLLLHDQIEGVVGWLAAFGGFALLLIAAAIAAYILYRWVQRRSTLADRELPRISVSELNDKLLRGEMPVIFDVRSAAQRRIDSRRIPGARSLELKRVLLDAVPADADVIVYCACHNDVSAVRAARLLRRRGVRRALPLAGGLDGWARAGLQLENWG